MRAENIILMSSDEKVNLILWQFEEIERLKKRVSELEKSNKKTKKDSSNSSIPSSRDFKKNKESEVKDRVKNHRNGGRELSENPDKIFDFKAFNSSEQALRPSVIFRKVTNGFRSQIGKDIFTNFRTVIDTAKKQGKNIFSTICQIFQNNNFSKWQYS